MINPLLAVRDVSASLAFYTEHLGFTVAMLLPGKDDEPAFATVQYDDVLLSLDNTEYADLPPNVPLGVGVDLFISLKADVDMDDLYGKLNRAGVTIIQPPKDEFWGDRRLIVNDPDGYRLSLYKTIRTVSTAEMTSHISS